ncbi:MAG TPA: YSC84-related protein [Steroidobacteraceae bacterium]|nr:YSC84-related protein [Steroidobacteraceae bacterium]
MRVLTSILLSLSLAFSVPVLANDVSNAPEKVQDTVENFKKAQLTKPYFENSHGYAVFPTIAKAGVGIGGAGGKGYVYEKGRFVGESSMGQISVGAQLGGQAYSQIVFFENKAAFDEFTREGFEFTADASAVALTLGANAEAGTQGVNAAASLSKSNGIAVSKYSKGMAIMTLAKGGLMYQAALTGQKYSYKAR